MMLRYACSNRSSNAYLIRFSLDGGKQSTSVIHSTI